MTAEYYQDDMTTATNQASETAQTTLLPRTPLPWRSITIIYLLNACQPLAFELIFPFVNQMILEIGVVDDKEKVGFYSGLIESIFACMSFLAIVPCTYFSDRYGRKPVILIGTCGLAVSTLLFGLSRHFWSMILTRCIGGAMGGSWGATEIMVAEMTDKSNEGTAFSGMMIAYGMGQVVGHPLGGFLSHPERNFKLFQSKFWYRYPFSLPCFVAAGFAVLSVLLGTIYLKETLISAGKLDHSINQPNYGTISSPTSSHRPSLSHSGAPKSKSSKTTLRSALTPQVLALVVNSAGMVVSSESILALYPLFAFTPVTSGGLGVSESAIGAHMGIRSVISIVGMILYGPLERHLGSMRLYKMALFTWPFAIAFMPTLNHIARNGGESSFVFNAVLLAFFIICSFANLAWTGVRILLNDATPSSEALATINGISQMAIVIPQGIAPAFANSLFAYSISSQVIGGNLIWVVLITLTGVVALHTLTLKHSTHDWRKERENVAE